MQICPSYLLYGDSTPNTYYGWCRGAGFSNVDVIDHRLDDGKWDLVEYYNAPIIPALTQWNYILIGITEPLIKPVIQKFLRDLDIHQKAYWAQQELEAKESERKRKAQEEAQDDAATRATGLIMGNPDLVNRIAKNGLQEALNPVNILKHIPRSSLNGLKGVTLK
jgi:hypothetical protein